MKKMLSVLCLTLVLLAVIDLGVAGVLSWANERGKLASLVQYFEYGRSVPGKLAEWEANPEVPGNLYDLAWIAQTVTESTEKFSGEDSESGSVLRSYGMSFAKNILREAVSLNPDLVVDQHNGPGPPPNYGYATFLDDAENRRAGDIALFAILSSSIPAMAAMSNSTWLFEQPAPFTYPIFHPHDAGLRRVDPLVQSAAAQLALIEQPQEQAAWTQQLGKEDLFYSPISFSATWLDQSPFARLVRRSLAKSHIERTKTEILSGDYPHVEVLQRMIATFAQTARNDGQIPIVMLIQTSDVGDTDVMAIAKPVLERDDIPYFATVEHFDPRDLSGFENDGHYRSEIDGLFGAALIELLGTLKLPEPK